MTAVSRRRTSGQRAAGEGGPHAPGRPATRRRGLAAPLALPAGFAALLTLGAVAAGTGGSVGPLWVLIIAGIIVTVGAAVAEPTVAPLLGAIGWLTVVGFSRAPYAQLHMTGAVAGRAAITMFACALIGAGAGVMVRRIASSFTLWIVDVPEERWPPTDPAAIVPDLQRESDGGQPEPAAGPQQPGRPQHSPPAPSGGQQEPAAAPRGPTAPQPAPIVPQLAPVANPPVPAAAQRDLSSPALRRRLGLGLSELFGGIGGRRLLAGVILVAGLPLLTAALVAGQNHLSLADDLLVYLVAVVAVAVVGGFWPAVLAAVTASLLLNWYFTRPVHTFTIEDPQNLLALLLFVTVAVTVSSVVHLSAHRALQAARSSEEAAELLALARTVLGGADTPTAVLEHLTSTRGGRAELVERVGAQWVRVAASGTAPAEAVAVRVEARPGLVLIVSAQSRQVTARLLDGFAAQAASALDRERLRTQAAQAEALAEGNRMRTALLRAVSHDLRTPLASIKASVSTLRQTDVQWTPADEAALLATIEQGADRLDALIGNLLDMSRLTTGSLQPFLRPTAIDEVAPVALRGLDAGGTVELNVPDGLPLVRTDPGLLERVLANLFANALDFSPPRRPPALHAGQAGDTVILEIIDHGPGVPDEFKARMFEPFERLQARTTGTGVGLGLAVVKGFLDTMGGSVTAADTPGGGLTIRVTLPTAERAPGPVGADPAEPRVAADP
jgi:two-component system sensor histidine kinase KdpD